MKQEIKIIIGKLFNGSITDAEKEQLLLWYNESEENRNEFARLKSIQDALQPAFNPEGIDLDKAEKALNDRINSILTVTPPHRKLNSQSIWLRVAAVVTIPVMLAIGYFIGRNSFDNQSLTAYQEISTPFGTRTKITLPDSSVVWLNAGSKLTYPTQFHKKQRLVALNGEAYFQVHANKNNPFTVQAGKLEVTATGTEFNVEAYYGDTINAVTLSEGIVDVIHGTTSGKLEPNQRFVLNTNTLVYNISETDADYWGIWKDGVLAFRNESLAEVFKKISRTFNVEFAISDPSLARETYRATFSNETLDEILALLKISAPIEFTRTSRTLQTNGSFSKEVIHVKRK